jgi:glycerol kinase
MSRYVLALDQGTTSSRAIIFDHAGRPVASAQQEFRQFFLQPGWVEHDPHEIWTSQLACARQALAQAGATASDVAAVGIANQRETTVLWERAGGRPVAPAIVWQDRRTADACARLRAEGVEPTVADKTGLLLDPYFSGTKLAWLLDNIAGARTAAERGELAFGTIDTWLLWNLTGGKVHATDPSNASRTLLFNLHALDWDDELLRLLEVPRAVLPAIVPSSGVVGHIRTDFLGGAIPIAGIAGDQQAALFGQACFAPGMAKNTYGTGCFVLLNTGTAPKRSTNKLLTTVGWMLEEGGRRHTTYCLEGSVFVGGALVQWLRDGLGIIERSDDVEALARQVPDAGGVVLVPAFTGLGAPYWDPNARGLLIGLTRGTTRAHVARAALEAIALQSAEVLEAMQRDAGTPLAELRVDGGAARNDLLMQLQADAIGKTVVRPAVNETTALGAAYLAGLGVGYWSGERELAKLWRAERRFVPALAEETRSAHLARWREAVARSRHWA